MMLVGAADPVKGYYPRATLSEVDQVVMSSKRTEKLAGYTSGKRPDWKVDIAEGFDASLVSFNSVAI